MSMPQAPHLLAKAQILRTSLREGRKTEEPLGESKRNIRRTYVAPWLPLALLCSSSAPSTSWLLLALPGFPWLQLAFLGPTWLLLATYGSSWPLMSNCYQLAPRCSQGFRELRKVCRVPRGLPQAPRSSQGSKGLQAFPSTPRSFHRSLSSQGLSEAPIGYQGLQAS